MEPCQERIKKNIDKKESLRRQTNKQNRRILVNCCELSCKSLSDEYRKFDCPRRTRLVWSQHIGNVLVDSNLLLFFWNFKKLCKQTFVYLKIGNKNYKILLVFDRISTLNSFPRLLSLLKMDLK